MEEITLGYQVFRYTGSEIVKDTLIIAREIIAIITDTPLDDLMLDGNLED